MAGIERSRLHEAAIEGNVTTLLELLRRDPLLLDRVNDKFTETPLHVAALLGHVRFVDEILKRRPQMAKELDSRRSTALHVAAAKGFVQIVNLLLRVAADLCLWCDADGRNPLHLAAMRGRINVLAELVGARPAAAQTAVEGGGTVLHLCVKYNQLEALRMLIESVGATDRGWVNGKDEYGSTVLHLAVSNKQLQTVQYLIKDTVIEVNALNSNGLTALDVLAQSHRDLKDMDIAETLRVAKAFRTTNKKSPPPPPPPSSSPVNRNLRRTQFCNNWFISAIFNDDEWLPEGDQWLRKQDSLMVVASLIATMAFQAGVNPPGGVWQDDTASGNPTQTAGTSILAGKHPTIYNKYLYFNTAGYMTSLIAILMLVTGLPRKPIFMRILIVTMWIAVSAMAYTYGYSIKFFTPQQASKPDESVIYRISLFAALVASSSLGVFFLGKIFYVLSQHARKLQINTHLRKLTTRQVPSIP